MDSLRAHKIYSAEWVKYLQDRFGGGFVLTHVMQLSILNLNSVRFLAIEKMLWQCHDKYCLTVRLEDEEI